MPQSLELLKAFEDGDFYFLGRSYLTSIANNAFCVHVDKHPAMFHVEGNEVNRPPTRCSPPSRPLRRLPATLLLR